MNLPRVRYNCLTDTMSVKIDYNAIGSKYLEASEEIALDYNTHIKKVKFFKPPYPSQLKQRPGSALKRGDLPERAKERMRQTAIKYPQFYGKWSNI